MRIHFIAIGGAAMHNLALALHEKHEITGSDDAIYEPSRSRLKSAGLLPDEMGWKPERVNNQLDLVILGMHAKKDNPELLKAQELGIPINSYPEFIANQSMEKQRVVVAGSHGKTSTTAMILHVLKTLNMDFDYMVGAQIKGFDTMVRLSDAPIIILEGDEYFSSPIDMKGKFLWYKPQFSIITGIAWDHINVYPTKHVYEEAFETFINQLPQNAVVYYYGHDEALKRIAKNAREDVQMKSYEAIEHQIRNGQTILENDGIDYPIQIFGRHNLENLEAARCICLDLGIDQKTFLKAISSFEGAANRLELIESSEKLSIFKDFAHSPSKLKATVQACKDQFDGNLLAVMELHTFSSLNPEFIGEYAHSMDAADTAVVFYNPETMAKKGMESISESELKNAFQREDILIYTDTDELRGCILKHALEHQTLLLMSSGNFGGIDQKELSQQIIGSV